MRVRRCVSRSIGLRRRDQAPFRCSITSPDSPAPKRRSRSRPARSASAAELGLMLVAPDTSPRIPRLPGDDSAWDFGLGAGFYVDATSEPWSRHYRMYSYVTRELPEIVAANFPARAGAQGIFGHSMGGHGALVCALRNPGSYQSLSAFAPIAAPSRCPWGTKAFSGYLGDDRKEWAAYDASELIAATGFSGPDTRRPGIFRPVPARATAARGVRDCRARGRTGSRTAPAPGL